MVPGAESNHRHEDFQSDLNFLNLIKSATYALPISVCASKCQLLTVTDSYWQFLRHKIGTVFIESFSIKNIKHCFKLSFWAEAIYLDWWLKAASQIKSLESINRASMAEYSSIRSHLPGQLLKCASHWNTWQKYLPHQVNLRKRASQRYLPRFGYLRESRGITPVTRNAY